jgi:hypothetical protein
LKITRRLKNATKKVNSSSKLVTAFIRRIKTHHTKSSIRKRSSRPYLKLRKREDFKISPNCDLRT